MPVSYIQSSSGPKVKSFELPITLTPCQKMIDKSASRFRLIRAGRKFGKTTFAQYSCIKKLGEPNARVFFVSPTYRQGKLISWSDFKKLIPREAMARKPNETELVITLKNGSELYVMGSDNEDSLRGPNPNHVVLEEAAMQKSNVWYEIIRPALTSKKGSADFITTPKGYNWFKDLEDSARKLIHQGNTDWSVFHFTINDNPHIDRAEILNARKDCESDVIWNQEYLAQYESSQGRVFSAYSFERHHKDIEIPQTRTEVYRAVDWGMRDDTACLWATIRGGALYIYREHLQKDTPASVQAGLILNKTTHAENVTMNAISHDAAKEDSDMRGLTVKWHFENAGMRPMYLSSRKKEKSRSMIQQLLHENRIFVDSYKCPKLHKQLLQYEWNDTINEAPSIAESKDDAVDALHYLVELLQFKLYLNKPQDEKTVDEKHKEIRLELLAQRTQPRKWSIKPKDELSEFDFENSAAGYF